MVKINAIKTHRIRFFDRNKVLTKTERENPIVIIEKVAFEGNKIISLVS